MKTTRILNNESVRATFKRLLALIVVKGVLAPAAGALLTIGIMPSAKAQAVYSVNIVGFRDVADRTVELLTQPMTTTQRQARHAKNFIELPPLQRAVYLHAVSFAISQAIASTNEFIDNPPGAFLCLTSDTLVDHLLTVPSIYEAPAVPSEDSQLVAAHLAIVSVALEELNVGFADQVANNPSLQQAMHAGAVYGLNIK